MFSSLHIAGKMFNPWPFIGRKSDPTSIKRESIRLLEYLQKSSEENVT
jgi:hypothetical protein